MTILMRMVAGALALLAAPAAGQTIDGAAALVGSRFVYEVKRGDTLGTIGARYGVSRATLLDLNPQVNDKALSPGQPLVIDNTHLALGHPQVNLTINIAQRLVVLTEGEQARAYPIAVGTRSWPTPVGAFTIVIKETDPAWDVPLSIQREMEQQGKPVITRMPPSPNNPLGKHWIGLSLPGLGIHGTNAPSSIYTYASHGCMRMHPDDVADLFERVAVGMSGVIVYRPVLVAVIGDRVWMEAHPDVYRRGGNAMAAIRDVAERASVTARIDWRAVEQALEQRRGRAVDVTLSTKMSHEDDAMSKGPR